MFQDVYKNVVSRDVQKDLIFQDVMFHVAKKRCHVQKVIVFQVVQKDVLFKDVQKRFNFAKRCDVRRSPNRYTVPRCSKRINFARRSKWYDVRRYS